MRKTFRSKFQSLWKLVLGVSAPGATWEAKITLAGCGCHRRIHCRNVKEPSLKRCELNSILEDAMNRGASYQLPDLPSLVRDFELHTNRHCHAISLSGPGKLVGDERDEACRRGMKAALLASLCFPTCDAPQLKLLADLMSAFICIQVRLIGAPDMARCGWTSSKVEADAASGSWELLAQNSLLRR